MIFDILQGDLINEQEGAGVALEINYSPPVECRGGTDEKRLKKIEREGG